MSSPPIARESATESDSAGSVSSGRKASPPTGFGGSSSVPVTSFSNMTEPSRRRSVYFSFTREAIVKYCPWMVCCAPKFCSNEIRCNSQLSMTSTPGFRSFGSMAASSAIGFNPESAKLEISAWVSTKPASETCKVFSR